MPGSFIIDIGSNDGSLLMPFKNAGMNVLGIDPAQDAAEKAEKAGIPTIPEPMSLNAAEKIKKGYGKADVVLMFNAFAHMDNLDEIAKCAAMLLKKDGIFVFESQYLADILEKRLVATIFHEHMSHHSITALVPFFEKHGLELIAAERAPIQHGSIIGTVQLKGDPAKKDRTVEQMLEQERNMRLNSAQALKTFAGDIGEMRKRVNEWAAKAANDGAVIAGYGAARSGPTLISQLGLKDRLHYILDDNPQKTGKYSSGDALPIIPVCNLYERMPEYTVILAWVHSARIIEANKRYLELGGKFLDLCSWPRLIGKDGETML